MPLVQTSEGLGVRSVGGGEDNAALVAEIRALQELVAELIAPAKRTADASVSTAKTLKNVSPNGNTIQTEAAA